MEKVIYIGVIMFFHTSRHWTIETTLCTARDGEEATAAVKNYARDFAAKNCLMFEKFQVIVQPQNESKLRELLYLAAIELKQDEKEIVEEKREFVM